MADFGRFVWYDLFAQDVDRACSFYAGIAGWTYTKGTSGDHQVILSGGEEIGRIAQAPEGVPPHWLGYVSVEDVAEMAQRAEALGGRILRPPTDIPPVGRLAVLADPQGAAFALFGSEPAFPQPAREEIGRFSWAELNTTNWESAWKFYSALFGWKKTSSMEMEEMGTYFMFGMEEKRSTGGMSNAATFMNAPPHWLYYFNVADIREALKQVEEAGGKVLNGPMEIPGDDWIAQCADPEGCYFALYQSGRS